MSGEYARLATANGLTTPSRQTTSHGLAAAGPLLDALVASLPIGVLLQGPDRRIVLVNAAFIRLTGIAARPPELIGVPFDGAAEHVHDLFSAPPSGTESDESPPVGPALLAGLDDGRAVERECVPLRSDGELLGHLWLLRDVTDQTAARRAAAEQERVLADLTLLRSDFIATLSHELRTPLTSLVGLSALLLDGDQLDQEQTECLQGIDRSADRLLRLTDGLTLLAGLESGDLPLRDEPVDLAGLVADRAAGWHEAAGAAGVGLRLEHPDPGAGPPLQGDQLTLARLLDDLVSGAIQASPPGGTVHLWLRPATDGWRIEVTGPGRQAQPDDPTDASRHTAGLGPIIGRAIVKRHHGTTTAHPATPTGSEIHIRLPSRPGPT